MPVYQLQEDMPYTEFLKWIEFFRRRPVGWRDDHRTSMIMNAFGVKEKGANLFPSLKVIADRANAEKAKGNALPTGKFLEMMRNAKGGDNSGWEMFKKE
jgi:hypothetical protein